MPKKKKGTPTPIVLGLIAGLILGWWIFPHVLYSEQEQPVHFSHKTHMNEDMECVDCHHYRSDGSFAGVPSVESCARSGCHDEVLTGTPAEEAFVKEYVKKGRPVDWKIYQKQPDNVYFSHIAHEDFECAECHPDVGQSEELPVYQENKITGYSRDTMKMDECERCHARRGASNGCFVCHK